LTRPLMEMTAESFVVSDGFTGAGRIGLACKIAKAEG